MKQLPTNIFVRPSLLLHRQTGFELKTVIYSFSPTAHYILYIQLFLNGAISIPHHPIENREYICIEPICIYSLASLKPISSQNEQEGDSVSIIFVGAGLKVKDYLYWIHILHSFTVQYLISFLGFYMQICKLCALTTVKTCSNIVRLYTGLILVSK